MSVDESHASRYRLFADNPFRTRDDVGRAVLTLLEPLRSCFSPGRARVRVASGGAQFDPTAAGLEGFARPLWGLAPLAAGGGASDAWELILAGIANGTDPAHPEFWGRAVDLDQRMVEMGAIGLALALAPERLWDPLANDQRAHLVHWLNAINEHAPFDNNWWFFRVLVNLGLKRVAAPWRRDLVQDACQRIDRFYLGDGWYRDGDRAQLDYYVAFAYHLYGLIYARLAGDWDAEHAANYRERARLFARDFRHWFGPDGAAIPFGRSLTYRFAQGAFWGALAFADVEALPWGETKGLYLRHLRWWSRQEIADRGGALTIGYAYENLMISEEYNSPQSPYWAMKAFLPLAVGAEHPFWTAAETASTPPALSLQKHAGLIVQRDDTHAVMLASGQHNASVRQGDAKYSKFAYSSRFGFSVESDAGDVMRSCFDNALAVAPVELPDRFRARGASETVTVDERWLYSLWRPWPYVEMETWLIPVALPWLLRVHRLKAKRPILIREAGFAAARPETAEEGERRALLSLSEAPEILIHGVGTLVGIRDLAIGTRARLRSAALARPLPNTNLMAPRTVLPVLLARCGEGEHLFATAVFATAERPSAERLWNEPPAVPAGPWLAV